MNLIVIEGHLGKDVELKYTAAGKAVAEFSVADNESDGKNEYTTWHNIVAWGKQAENANQYLSKGSHVLVTGRVNTENWEKDGVKKYKTKITASKIKYLDKVQRSEKQDVGKKPANKYQEDIGHGSFKSDDIPF